MRPNLIKTAAFAATAALGLSLFGGVATANNGNGVAGDPIRLALTICSDAGIGNGGEFEIGLRTPGGVRVIYSECLEKRLGSLYTPDEIAAILASAGCVLIGPVAICEIDPGNSADHNANPI